MATADAHKRLALVIGNSGYHELRSLANANNDASAVAERLQALGFTLIGRDGKPSDCAVLDLDEDGFSVAIRRFARAATGAEIAMVYYAGHGMQFYGKPYLLPIDVPRDDLELVRRNAIELDEVLRRLDGKAALTVAVFDACREIPEMEQAIEESSRAGGYGGNAFRGLARIKSKGRSRIVAYSGAAGQLVKDGDGLHSPYTEVLLAQLDQPGMEVGDLFRQVAYRFGQSHGGQQPKVLIQGVPPRRYYFAPRGPVAPLRLSPPPPPVAVGWLLVVVDAADAKVWVNGQLAGEAAPGRPAAESRRRPARRPRWRSGCRPVAAASANRRPSAPGSGTRWSCISQGPSPIPSPCPCPCPCRSRSRRRRRRRPGQIRCRPC